MTEYTKGEWKVRNYTTEDGEFDVCVINRGLDAMIARVGGLTAIKEAKANAHLIVAAINACISVNPDNPLAVAESIKPMYEALKLYQSHQQGTGGHYCYKCAEAINKSIAKAEGK